MKPRICVPLLGALLLAACEGQVPYQLPGEIVYTVGETTILPTPDGRWARPFAINASGWIVGETYRNDAAVGSNAALWRDGQIEILHQSEWDYSTAYDVNDRFEIVGEYEIDPPEDEGNREVKAFMLRAGTPYLLGDALEIFGPGIGVQSAAIAINERGWVVGYAHERDREASYGLQAIIWNTAVTPVTWLFVGTGDDERQTRATDINELHVTIGKLENPPTGPNDPERVFTNFGAPTSNFLAGDGRCGTTGDLANIYDRLAINNDNWIVGSTPVSGVCRAVRFQGSSPPILLSGTSTTETSHAFDVSDLKVIVGENAKRPVFWTPDGELIELPTQGQPFGRAVGVNGANEIVGFVYSEIFEWIPVLWRLDVEIVIPPGPNP